MIIEIANRSQAVVRAEHGPMERNLSPQRSGLANVGCPGFQMPRDLVVGFSPAGSWFGATSKGLDQQVAFK